MKRFSDDFKKTGMNIYDRRIILKKQIRTKKSRNNPPDEKLPRIQLPETNLTWEAARRKNAPADATHYSCGHFYKYGRHGFVFVWEFGEWIKCGKELSNIEQIKF